MRSYTVLWFAWALWVAWIIKAIYPDYAVIDYGIIFFLCGMLILFLRPFFPKGYSFMRFLKRENKTERAESGDSPDTTPRQNTASQSDSLDASTLLQPDGPEKMKPIITRKDTFISSETTLVGNLSGHGNMVIEGHLDGNIHSTHQVRIEPEGQVKGDIHAHHIVVNGRVEGRLYADAITLQPEGHIEGDLVTDALIIEKGGVFIGQSLLKTEVQPALHNDAAKPFKLTAETKISTDVN